LPWLCWALHWAKGLDDPPPRNRLGNRFGGCGRADFEARVFPIPRLAPNNFPFHGILPLRNCHPQATDGSYPLQSYFKHRLPTKFSVGGDFPMCITEFNPQRRNTARRRWLFQRYGAEPALFARPRIPLPRRVERHDAGAICPLLQFALREHQNVLTAHRTLFKSGSFWVIWVIAAKMRFEWVLHSDA
jgi:hypothetical protein